MKSLFLKILLALVICNLSSMITTAQTLKELMDSCKVYQEKQDFETALKWALQAEANAKEQLDETDTSFIPILQLVEQCSYYSGNPSIAVDYCEKTLQIIKNNKGMENLDYAETVGNLGFLYDEIGRHKEAEDLNIKSLELKRRIYKGDHPNLAISINNLASLYSIRGRFHEAAELHEEGLAMFRRIYNTDHPDLATAINNTASFYENTGKYDIALKLFSESLDMRRRLFKSDNKDLLSSLNNMATFLHNRGRYDEARAFYDEALAMTNRLYRTDHPSMANTLSNFASLYKDLGQFKEAEKYYVEALRVRRHLYPSGHLDLAHSMNNLAAFYADRGRYTEAELLYKEALAMFRSLIQTDHPDLAATLNNLAVFYFVTGKFKDAEESYLEALAMTRRIFLSDHPNLATTISNTGIFFEKIGRQKEALALYKESLDMKRRLYQSDHPELATSLNNMGYLLNAMEEYNDALPLLTEALEMRRRIYKNDHTQIANSLNNLGYYYFMQGKYDEAEPYLTQALEMRRRIFKTDHRDLANSVGNLGRLFAYRRQFAEAEQYYKEAIDIMGRLVKLNHPDLVAVIEALASLYAECGKYEEADSLFNLAINSYQIIINNYFPALSEIEKEQFWNNLSGQFENFNVYAANRSKVNKSLLDLMYDGQLFSKAILLNSINRSKSRIVNSGDSSVITSFHKWSDMKELLIKLYKFTPDQLKKKDFNIDSVEQVANKLEKELSLKSEDFRQVYDKQSIKWKSVQSRLKSNEAAIEIIRFKYPNLRGEIDYQYAALIVKPMQNNPDIVIMKNGSDLEGRYLNFYKKLVDKQKSLIFDQDIVLQGMKELYQVFWAPIHEKLKGIKKIYLSPDGVYNLININTLINPISGNYVLEETDLRILTCTRDLVDINRFEFVKDTTKINIIHTPLSKVGNDEYKIELFGDPQFNFNFNKNIEALPNNEGSITAVEKLKQNSIDINPIDKIATLPGTRKEIENIAGSFQKQGWRVNRHLGPEALEEALKAVDNPRVLHIATHGKFLKDVERRNDERMIGFETQRFVENPLLRSMLLFSGAENTLLNQGQQPATQREDGLLTAYEAQNLNLDNTELVVLSACETGLGEVRNGEGVYGLQRAFQVAGAKSLIMSLWSVSDEATQELMTSFYSKWLGGKSKREAFREAQIKLKKKYPGFYYWGAFVMVGE